MFPFILQGDLIGKRLLVGFMDSSSDIFPIFVRNDTGARDGSIFKFILDVADSVGVGLYATKQYSHEATSKYPEKSSINLAHRCFYDLEFQSVSIDMCIGEYLMPG